MWRETQRRDQDRRWTAVERVLDSLPPGLFRQAKLLEYDMGLRWSTTGQFRDVFLGVEQFPLTSIAPWLLDDLGAEDGAERDDACSRLLVAAVLLAARTSLVERILDPSSFVGREHVALIEVLSERTMTELAAVVPSGATFWEARAAIAGDDLDAMLADADRRRVPTTNDDPTLLLRPVWSAPARVLALAATGSRSTTSGGRSRVDGDIDTKVASMLEALAEAVQIRDDLATMQHDLEEGRPSFPIAMTAVAAGLPLHPWPSPTVVLGAMVLTGSLGTILDAAIGRLRVSRTAAIDARLPTFIAYLDAAIASLEERRPGSAAAGRGTVVSTRGGAPLVPAAEPTLSRAMAMAEGFLLAGDTLRQSWEMHREGMFGAAAVWSRFPEGLILEILAGHGHDMTAELDDLVSFTVANGFRYYAHPWSGVDSDTVGVVLRLLPMATPDERHRIALDPVLRRLDAQVRASGAVPVWVAADDGDEIDRPRTLDLGEGCGTVAAHLLLGLLADGNPEHDETITRGAGHLLGRIVDVGLGANVDYPPVYALAQFEQLIARLSSARPETAAVLAESADAARGVLAGALERACARGPRTPQDAALLTFACLESGREERLEPGWQATILKGQRFDGGWNGEAFAAAPNRGRSVTWYESAPLTSALCYDALRRTTSDRAPGTGAGRRPTAPADARPTSVA